MLMQRKLPINIAITDSIEPTKLTKDINIAKNDKNTIGIKQYPIILITLDNSKVLY